MRSSLLQSLGNVCSRTISAFPGCASANASAELLETRLSTLTRGFHTDCVRDVGPPHGACPSHHWQPHDRASFRRPAQLLSVQVSGVLDCSTYRKLHGLRFSPQSNKEHCVIVTCVATFSSCAGLYFQHSYVAASRYASCRDQSPHANPCSSLSWICIHSKRCCSAT